MTLHILYVLAAKGLTILLTVPSANKPYMDGGGGQGGDGQRETSDLNLGHLSFIIIFWALHFSWLQ